MRNWEYYLVVVAAGPRPIDRRRIRLLTTPTSTPSNTDVRGLAKLKQTVRKVAGLGRKVARGVGPRVNLGRFGLIGGLSDLRGFQATVIRANRAA